MAILILGLVVFFGIHLVRIVAPGFRAAQVAANENRWKGIYSVVSLVGIALIIWGWHLYRFEAPEIYEPPSWGRHLTALLVLIAFILIAAANAPAGYIRNRLKHPFLTGIILWSTGHLLANGDLASLLLFGSFLVYAVVDLIAVIPRGDPAPAVVKPRSDIIAIVAGVVVFAVFGFWLHGWLFGAYPFA
jgi:uncharacterized membrane protein